MALALLLMASGSAAAAERTWLAGRINSYARPTATAAGSVTIGTQTYSIAAGVSFAPASEPQPGAVMSILAELGPAGELTMISAVNPYSPPYPACGPVTSFRAATATETGQIVQTPDGTRRQLTIKAGIALPSESASGYRCFIQELTAQGDLLVIGAQDLPVGFVTPAPSSAQLPSTASNATPASANERSGPPEAPSSTGLLLLAVTLVLASAVGIWALLRRGRPAR
jgi:hypothetical protein